MFVFLGINHMSYYLSLITGKKALEDGHAVDILHHRHLIQFAQLFVKLLSCDTVEPLNNGHFRTSNFWYNFTVIERLSSFRGKIVLPWSCRDHKICPL